MAARKASKSSTRSVRLSSDILPLSYTIHFEPNFETFTFIGTEEIVLELKRPTKKIILHSAEIEVVSAEITQGKDKQTGKVSYRQKDEEVEFEFGKNIPKGKATLKLKFSGLINDKMRGFYRSRYVVDGKEYYMGVTQFESTDARRAFPCFDEPEKKAIFNVSFTIPDDRIVISNTLEEETLAQVGGKKIVRFSKSPKMSTYLLAFIIGHFEHIEAKTKGGVVVRVYVTPGKKKQAEFALKTAVKCLEFYVDYFKIKYPLPSMDLVAIPDFAAGAMENWGAVTYRETALLVDPEHSSTHNKQWVALVIAHELAHQWFGNLVTMEWWTDLWLNEGFASYMEYVAVDKIFPEWHIWTQFVYMDHARALELDGLKNTHPIEVEVNHPAEISEIFDEVSYSKGASVIRMLAEYLGYTSFRDGLRYYLKKHSYGNAKTEDLWRALSYVSKKDVLKIMQNWTKTPGYPLISVEEDKNGLKVSQQRFFSSVFSQKQVNTQKWMTPITLQVKNKNQQFLLEKKQDLVKANLAEWVKVNKNETSFMRVTYSQPLLSSLKKPIEQHDKNLSEEDRFGIIRDLFVLSEAGFLPLDQALDLSFSYKNDRSYIVWAQIASDMLKLRNLFFGEAFYPEFEKYVLGLFSEIMEKVGWEKKRGEEHSVTLLRSIVIGILGKFGDKKTIKSAQEKFKLDKTGKMMLAADLRGVVYSLVCENGGKKEHEAFIHMYKETQFQEEKDRILRALCAFKDESLLLKTLDFAFSNEVKAQDSFKAVAFIWGNPNGRQIAWKYVKKEWGNIEKKYAGGHLFTRFIKPASNFTTEKDAKNIEAFFKGKKTEGLERTIAQALEQIRSNAAWIKRDRKNIQKFLNR